jgi:hypothetical protein
MRSEVGSLRNIRMIWLKNALLTRQRFPPLVAGGSPSGHRSKMGRLLLPSRDLYRVSSHVKIDESVRHSAAALSVGWSIAWARSMAFRFISRSVVA